MRIIAGKYMHFKGKEYEVLGVAKHSETLEDFVVYKALYGKREIWIRPKSMFLEKVSWKGRRVPRFKPMLKGSNTESKAHT